MKAKTIRKILRAKLEALCKSIQDEKVRRLVKDNSIITGGAIVSLLLGEEPNDFDIYFTNAETAEAVALYYFNQMPDRSDNDKVERYIDSNNGEERVRIFIRSRGTLERRLKASEVAKGKFVPVFMTDNAISLSDDVQLVLRFFGKPEEIHKNYDFVHCTSYWVSRTGELVLPQAALEAIITKELRYVGSRYPICSLVRIRKFIERGFTINAGQIMKIVMQIHRLNLKDINVLNDQLLGVDASYFREFIRKLELGDVDIDNVDPGYLGQILDDIFDDPNFSDFDDGYEDLGDPDSEGLEF